jgi:two-component system OmpR family response regulator
MQKLIVVDDDPHIRELMSLYLRNEGYEVLEAGNGGEAVTLLKAHAVSLVILDIMMPGMDGWELARYIRERSEIPMLMVTAKGEPLDKYKGFQIGADDYLVKPFDLLELVMRVKALLKRSRSHVEPAVQIGPVRIDRNTFEVRIGEERITLPLKEFELLYHLASHPGRIFTREKLIEQIWGFDYEGDDRTIDVHIKRLRSRFADHADALTITTIRGLGYRLEAPR